MKNFLHLFIGSMCIIGFVNSMILYYKYDSNWKMSLFCIFMGLVSCMAAISEIKEYLKK